MLRLRAQVSPLVSADAVTSRPTCTKAATMQQGHRIWLFYMCKLFAPAAWCQVSRYHSETKGLPRSSPWQGSTSFTKIFLTFTWVMLKGYPISWTMTLGCSPHELLQVAH